MKIAIPIAGGRLQPILGIVGICFMDVDECQKRS